MTHINLLPWREERRQNLQKEFYTVLGAVVILGVLAWGVVHFYHMQAINAQQSRVEYVKRKVDLVDKQISEVKSLNDEKKKLFARISAVEQLQQNRPLIVHLFDEIVRTLPEGASLKDLNQNGNIVTVTGVAQSNARVSSFMRNISASKWLDRPKLNVIQAENKDNTDFSDFTLAFEQVVPSDQ